MTQTRTVKLDIASRFEMLDVVQTVVTHLATLVGFGILNYDLPVLIRRSQYLRIKVPPIQMGRYKHDGVIDLMDELSFSGLKPYHSLNFYCRRFELGPFEDEMTGKGVGLAVTLSDWVSVERHCRCDVEKTTALARRLGKIA